MINTAPITLEQIENYKAVYRRRVRTQYLLTLLISTGVFLTIVWNSDINALLGGAVAALPFSGIAAATYNILAPSIKPISKQLTNGQSCNINYSFDELTNTEASILAENLEKGVEDVREYIKSVNAQGREYVYHDRAMCNAIIKEKESIKEKKRKAQMKKGEKQ